ncbi:ABC transporter permease [Arcanobacterium hippocoleae]
MDTTAVVFIGISILSLAVSAIGMLNIGLSTLNERADELSLRRSFGMKKYQIAAIMLLEVQITAILAGTIGVVIAYFSLPVTLNLFGMTDTLPSFLLEQQLLGCALGILLHLSDLYPRQ